MNDDQTAKEREQAILAAQEIETHLFRLTAMELEYRQAEARHNREQSGASWKHKDDLGKVYTQENQWFYDRLLLPLWSEGEKRFIKVTHASEGTDEGDKSDA